MNRDTEIQTQRAVLDQARARHLGSLGAFVPRLSGQFTDTQTYEPYDFRTRKALGLVSVNLFKSGLDAAAFSATDWGVAREEAALADAGLSAERKNAQLLLAVIQNRQRHDVVKMLYESNQQVVHIVDERYRRGLIPLQEVQKASIERDNSMARWQDTAQNLATVQAQAVEQVGGEPLPQQWPWREFLEGERARRLLQLEFRLQDLPRWRRQEAGVTASEYRIRESWRGFFPSLDLVAGYGYMDLEIHREPGWMTALTLTVPLVNLGTNSTYREQVAQARIETLNRETTRRDAEADWRSAKERFEVALGAARSRQANVALARGLYDDNRRRLQQGRSSVNDVAVDQNRLADAELLAVDGWAIAHQTYLELCHALGMSHSSCRQVK